MEYRGGASEVLLIPNENEPGDRPGEDRGEPRARGGSLAGRGDEALGRVAKGMIGRAGLAQGSSAFFCEIRRRTRSASRMPSNGFLKASLNPRA